MMAPRKSKASTLSSAPFDQERFVNEKAAKQYVVDLSRKSLVAERGLQVTDFEFENTLMEFGWGRLVEHPRPAVIPIVREFYANAQFHNEYQVMVRGRVVEFSQERISSLYGLTTYASDEDKYKQFIDEQVDPSEVLAEISEVGAAWVYGQHGPKWVLEKHLKVESKALHRFISARIMPSGHLSEVTWDRAVLIYCLCIQGTVDVGRIIHGQICDSIHRSSTGGFCFPHLITELCAAAGVVWENNLEVMLPRALITHRSITRGVRRNIGRQAPPAAPQPAAPQRQPEKEEAHHQYRDESIEDLTKWMNELHKTQKAMHADVIRHEERMYAREQRAEQFRCWLADRVCDFASHLGIDTSRIPPWPPAPQRPDDDMDDD